MQAPFLENYPTCTTTFNLAAQSLPLNCMPKHDGTETGVPWHKWRTKDSSGEFSLSVRWIPGIELRLSCLATRSLTHRAILPVFLLAYINITIFFFFYLGVESILNTFSWHDYTNHSLSCTFYVVPQKS